MANVVIPQYMIERALNKAIAILIDRYDQLGMRASSKWAESLEPRVEGMKGFIYGEDYTKYLTQGRPPGTNPPVPVIFQWMKDKKSFRGPKTLGRAIAISRSIGSRGTSWFRLGGSDLLEILESNQVIEVFNEELKVQLEAKIADDLRRLVTEDDFNVDDFMKEL